MNIKKGLTESKPLGILFFTDNNRPTPEGKYDVDECEGCIS